MRRALWAVLAVVAVAGTLAGCTYRGKITLLPEGNGWPESAEFSQLMTGQTRFSTHDSGLRSVLVIVDHQTGVQYLLTATGACPLLDVDGSPLRVLEASDDGE